MNYLIRSMIVYDGIYRPSYQKVEAESSTEAVRKVCDNCITDYFTAYENHITFYCGQHEYEVILLD